MSIADAPLWAQTPTAEVRREITFDPINAGTTEPFWIDLVWVQVDDEDLWQSCIGADLPGGMSIGEAHKLWVALGELLAIEATGPRDAHVAAEPWMTDLDGSRSRFKRTPSASTGAQTGDGTPIWAHVELYDDVNRPGRPDALDAAEISLQDERCNSIGVDSPTDARALAFALFKAARVVEMATATEVMQP